MTTQPSGDIPRLRDNDSAQRPMTRPQAPLDATKGSQMTNETESHTSGFLNYAPLCGVRNARPRRHMAKTRYIMKAPTKIVLKSSASIPAAE